MLFQRYAKIGNGQKPDWTNTRLWLSNKLVTPIPNPIPHNQLGGDLLLDFKRTRCFWERYSQRKSTSFQGLPFGHCLRLWAFVLLVSDFERNNKNERRT